MKDLTLVQEYLICQMNKKGKFNTLDVTANIALVVASVIELLQNDIITIEDKEVIIKSELTEQFSYLKTVYDFINISKTSKLKKIVCDMCFVNKLMNELFEDIKLTLHNEDCLIEKVSSTLFKNKIIFAAKETCVESIIQKIRAEILEDGEIDDNTSVLVSILGQTDKIKDYFSQYESDTLKKRIKELKNNEKYKSTWDIIEYVEFLFVVVVT